MSTVGLVLLLVAASPGATGAGPSGIGDTYTHGVHGEVATAVWWAGFADPQLSALIENALDSNHDVAAAVSRLARAAAIADQARAPMLPSVAFNASLNAQPFSNLGFQFGGDLPTQPGATPPEVLWRGSATIDARYQLDSLWRQALFHRAARLSQNASRDDRDAFATQLTTQMAEAYFDVVAAKERLTRLEEQITTNASLLELIELRFERGEATGLDVLQQRQQTAAARARKPEARSQLRLQRQRLLVLSGRSVDQELPAFAGKLPELPPKPGTGHPKDLINNRPDLRAANARYQAAEQRTTGAHRGHMPSLALTAQAGVLANRTTDLSTTDTWGAGLALSVPLFRGGADVATVHQAKAEQSAARHTYDQLVLQAVAQVEAAMIQADEQGKALTALKEQHTAAQLALQESKARYVAGLSSYVSVLLALNGLHGAELNIIQSKRALLSSRIQLHLALGGPWTRGLLDSKDRRR